MARVLAAVALSLIFLSCSKPANPEEVDNAGTLFFERFKEANYDKIYDKVSSLFRDQNARATATDKMKEMAALGSVASWERMSMAMGKESGRDVVTPVYLVQPERVRCEITLKFIDESADWKLLGFALRPLAVS